MHPVIKGLHDEKRKYEGCLFALLGEQREVLEGVIQYVEAGEYETALDRANILRDFMMETEDFFSEVMSKYDDEQQSDESEDTNHE